MTNLLNKFDFTLSIKNKNNIIFFQIYDILGLKLSLIKFNIQYINVKLSKIILNK